MPPSTEFQKRGLIHFHAVVRLDGPAGPDDAPPTWATTELLTDAVEAAHAATRVTAPEVEGTDRELAWVTSSTSGPSGPLRPTRSKTSTE